MRRLIVLSMVFAIIGAAFATTPAHAQTDPAAPGPGFGESVPFFGQDGSPIGSVTIDEIVEPFEAYGSGNEPLRGYYYALVNVTVTNTASRPVSVEPSSFRVFDSDGFQLQSAYLYLTSEDAPVFLEYTDALAPGDSVSGAVAFQVYSQAPIERIVYSPSFESRVTVLDLRMDLAVAGSPVSIVSSSGSEMAQVTVNGVADPFEGFSDFSAPSRGSRYVMIDVTVENTGSQILSTSPSDFSATDDQGFYLQNAFVSPSDPNIVSFDYLDLAPGETQSGVIFYQVLSGIPIEQITYGDFYTRTVVVADLAAGAPEITITAAATPDVSTLVSSPDCEGLIEWANDLVDRLGEAVTLTNAFDDVATEELDPVAVRQAAVDLEALGQAQRDSNPPPAAEQLNTFMAEQFYAAMSSATGKIADALETGNSVSALLAIAEAESVMALFESGGQADLLFEELETACPAEFEILENQ